MSSALDRVLSATLVVGTIVVAGSFAYRTFAPPSVNNSPQSEVRPVFVETWRESLQYGTTILGPESASITIQEFTDLECPACRAYHPGLIELVSRYPDQVRLVYMPYPLSIHRFAMGAARAADCIADSDHPRLSAWIDVMYEGQDSLGLRSWGSYAAQAGISDTVSIGACAQSPLGRIRIDSTLAYGTRHEINGTPTLMLSGWLYRGLPTITALEEQIRQLIDSSSVAPQ